MHRHTTIHEGSLAMGKSCGIALLPCCTPANRAVTERRLKKKLECTRGCDLQSLFWSAYGMLHLWVTFKN